MSPCFFSRRFPIGPLVPSPKKADSARLAFSASRFLSAATAAPAALLLVLLSCCHVASVRAAAFRVTDEYHPSCGGGLMGEPDAGGFHRWSDWRTWGPWAKFLGVPGTGLRRWADVTIPCGKAVLLDIPDISVGSLRIKGLLKVLDSPSLPSINVRANFIMVFGRLIAGDPSNHFAGRLTFTMHPNARGGRGSYELKYKQPADRSNPRDLGHKTFAVVGGQVSLYGMPGGSSTPSWVRLTETASAGAQAIYVDSDVTRWAPGMTLALASTSADLNDAEHHVIASVATITAVSKAGRSDGRYRIGLKTALRHRHEGVEIADGVGGTVGVYGEVALLDRHIVITSTDEPAPNHYDGGNFMVYMTPTAQAIVGVQFRGLGKQGTLGKYPLHFHVCGQSGERHVVRKNAIVFTKQRCMVIHATGNMTIEDNVAYETKGHCYLLEEGSEMRNVFRRNLGINARKVEKVIPPTTSSRLDFQTDKQPTTFWLATPFSSFIDNVAAGSEDSGFWLEANPYMRGLSRLLPTIGTTAPFYYNWGTWDGNHAHSNALFGFRTYPHGSRPRYPSPTVNPRVSLKNFLIYRNRAGIFFFNSERLIVENGVFLDNGIGIDLSRNSGVQSKGCRFIGRSSSSCPTAANQVQSTATPLSDTGTSDPNATVADVPGGPSTLWEPFTLQASLGPLHPYDDYSATGSFASSTTASSSYTKDPAANIRGPFNEAKGSAAARAAATGGSSSPLGLELGDEAGTFGIPIGITVSQSNPQDHLYPNAILDTSFHRYGTCSSSSFGIALVANKAGGYWNTAMSVKGLSFSAGTNKFWATPNPASGPPPRGGLLARFYAIRDLDGSLLGQPGYAVANYDPILPPAAVRSSLCSFRPAFSAYSCSSLCYRSVGVEYDEYAVRANSVTGVSGSLSSTAAVVPEWSYLRITRTDDGTSFLAYGTDNDNPGSAPGSGKKTRYLTASLLAGYTYKIEVVPAEGNSGFYPSRMQLNVFDWQGCSGAVTVIFDSPTSRSVWAADAPTVPCSSVDATRVYKEFVCHGGKSRLQLDIGASSSGKALTTLTLNTGTSTACSSDSACSLTTATLPPLSISPVSGSESSFSAADPFYDPTFYAPSTDPGTADGSGGSSSLT